MNTTEINNLLALKLGKTQQDTRTILDAIAKILADALVDDETYTVPGLGTFETRMKKARKAFNPSTKEIVTLPATKTVYFHPSSGLKETVKE